MSVLRFHSNFKGFWKKEAKRMDYMTYAWQFLCLAFRIASRYICASKLQTTSSPLCFCFLLLFRFISGPPISSEFLVWAYPLSSLCVLRSPDHRFYDIINYTEVAVKEVDLYGERIGLVVVFNKENDVYHIVTLYPSRQFHLLKWQVTYWKSQV